MDKPNNLIRQNWPLFFSIIVVVVDFLLLNLSFIIAIYLRFPNFGNPLYYWEPWVFVVLAFFPLVIALGLYRGIFQSSLENQKIDLKKFTVYLALFTMSYLFMIQGQEYSRGVVVIFLMTQYIILEISHSVLFRWNRRLTKQGFGKINTVIVGADASAKSFSNDLANLYGSFYSATGFIKNGNPDSDDPELRPFILGKYEDVDLLIRKLNIEQVFIVSDSMLEEKYNPIREACEKHEVRLKMISPAIKSLMQQSKVKDVTGVPLTGGRGADRKRRIRMRTKRILDLMILAVSSIVLVPLAGIIALLIKLSSPGPVFFKQKRALYKGGPSFWFYKFRTMYENADQIKDKMLHKNETNGALFKMKKDPRVTPVGRILRKYSFDEIPQFINVLKSEMSIVGPRPLPECDFDMIQNGKMNYDWYTKRGVVKPGITGLWQISGRSDLNFEEMCMLDFYYIENQSAFFDVEIMFETIPAMFMGKGAY